MFEALPVGAFLGEESFEVEDHGGVGSEGLAAFDVEVAGDEGTGETLGGSEGHGDAAALEDGVQFAQAAPMQVAGEGLVELIDGLDLIVGEDSLDARGAGLDDHAQVLVAEDLDGADEAFGGDGIVEGGQEEEQGATAESDAEERGEFLEVRRDGLGLERDEFFAAGSEVAAAGVRPDERLDLGGKGQEAEQIALSFGDRAEDEGRLDELFEERFGAAGGRFVRFRGEDPAGETGGIDKHVDLLGSFDLEDLGDRMAAFGGCAPVDVVDRIAGDVVAEFFEVPAAADLSEGADSVEGAGEEGGVGLDGGGEVGLDADLALHGKDATVEPEAEG